MASMIKLCPTLKELRILFSPVNSSSNGVREFLRTSYSVLKKNNPNVKFMVREADSVGPKVFARYEFGKEAVASVDNASGTEILEKVKKLGSV